MAITLIATSNNPNRLPESMSFSRLALPVPGVGSHYNPATIDYTRVTNDHAIAWKRAVP
jgi:hypothetical protein